MLIIDEINRGNLAKVFGELYFLLEYRDRRRSTCSTPPTTTGFTLPKNVFIIGTMNTADRSIALVDAAMRRRFAFEALHPPIEPTSGILRSLAEGRGTPARVRRPARRAEQPDRGSGLQDRAVVLHAERRARRRQDSSASGAPRSCRCWRSITTGT